MQQSQRSGAQRAPQQQERPRSQALVLTGASSDAHESSALLKRARSNAHLVSPATSVAMLPEGCSIVLSAVEIGENETYNVSGKRGLSKSALDRIAATAGISWNPEQSGRLDDGSDPYYCAWRAVGTLRHLDGTEITIEGSKEMDLREGSPQIEALFDRYKAAKSGRNPRDAKDPTAQIREMRLHIMAHAESKARLRAIRSIGVRSAYEPEELKKPFIVARLMFTGYSDDPSIRARFAELTAQAFLGGRRALYGGTAPAPAAPITARALPSASVPRLAPPPVGRAHLDDEDDDFTRGAPQREPMRAEKTPPRAQPARDESEHDDVEDAEFTDEREPSGFTIPGGRSRGTPIEEADDGDVAYWADRITKGLADGSSRYPDKDRALLAALRNEQGLRDALPSFGGGQ